MNICVEKLVKKIQNQNIGNTGHTMLTFTIHCICQIITYLLLNNGPT